MYAEINFFVLYIGMRNLLIILSFILTSKLYAQATKELERINFYPKVNTFFRAEFIYQTLTITTPQNALNEKEIKNYQNSFSFTFGHKLRWFFLGLTALYEIASESAANYGLPSDNRYSSHDFRDPELFLNSRLLEQTNEHGNIDLYLSFSNSLGAREIGRSTANRLNGANIFVSEISHGMRQQAWEFKSSLKYTFLSEGQENNDFTQKEYKLGSYNTLTYFFMTQYQINAWLFINGGFGFEYRTVQKIKSSLDDKSEIQEGTGSIFRLGMKKPLNENSLVELNYQLKRTSYFVKGISNFDGDSLQNNLSLSYIKGF